MQTDYSGMPKGVEGGLGDSGIIDIITRRCASIVKFGYGLIVTATEGLAALPSATGFTFEGISVMIHKAIPNSTGEAQYEIDEAISVLRKGRIWVLSESIVNPSSPVFLRHTVNGGTTAPGRFRIDADTARADDISANARWLTTTTAIDQLALLEINLP